MDHFRHRVHQWLAAFRRRWNEDMQRTREASAAADMEFRRQLSEAVRKIEENERQNASTRRGLKRLAEMTARHGARLTKHDQELLEHDQRLGVIDAVMGNGSGIW